MIKYDEILYVGNMDRAGLYKLLAIHGDKYSFECIYGPGTCGGDINDYAHYMNITKDGIDRLIDKRGYVPIYTEKELLQWKLKNA